MLSLFEVEGLREFLDRGKVVFSLISFWASLSQAGQEMFSDFFSLFSLFDEFGFVTHETLKASIYFAPFFFHPRFSRLLRLGY